MNSMAATDLDSIPIAIPTPIPTPTPRIAPVRPAKRESHAIWEWLITQIR